MAARALVLRLVNGETLAERIRRGPVSVAEALTIARQIAEALGAAHERHHPPGSETRQHQDHHDGIVKVLDFGIAKATRADAASDSMHSPTVALDATRDQACSWGLLRTRPRAGAREDGRRQARRHLGVRVRAVRDAHRPTARSLVHGCRRRHAGERSA